MSTSPMEGSPPPAGPSLSKPAGATGPSAPSGPSGPSGPTGPSGPSTPAGSQFWVWLHSLGVRRGRDRWLGGVCAAVAARLGLAPLVVRTAVLVLALLGGVGVLLYAVAWLLLPDEEGRIEARRVLAGEVSAPAAVALVVLVLAVLVPAPQRWWERGVLVGGDDVLGAVVLGTVVVALAVWLPRILGRERPARTGSSSRPAREAAAGSGQPRARVERRRPLPLRGAVVGLALVAAGLTWWVAREAGLPAGLAPGQDVDGLLDVHAAVAVTAAVAAVVLGTGTAVAGAVGRSSAGMAGLGTVAALVAVIAALVPGRMAVTAAGDPQWRPTTVAAAHRGYALAAGDGVLDLTHLPLLARGQRVEVPVRLGAGDLRVVVPEGARVQVRARLGAGEVLGLATWTASGDDQGVGPDVLATRGPAASSGDAGTPGLLAVDVVQGAGQVTLAVAGAVTSPGTGTGTGTGDGDAVVTSGAQR